MSRFFLALLFAGLLWAALRVSSTASAMQGAVAMSKPGHEDLTFWAHRRGLEELDFEGEVGFGDMARVLLRRRTNAAILAEIRDRFTFRTADMARLVTPDVFYARVSRAGVSWENRPERLIAAAGRVYNVPVIVQNTTGAPVSISLQLLSSNLSAQEVPANGSSGYLLRFREGKSGVVAGTVTIGGNGKSITAPVTFEVRPLVSLRVRVQEPGGQVTPARVYLTASDGLSYVPKNHIPRIMAMSAEYYFHAAKDFDVQLPAGPARIEVARGPEYEISSQLMNLERGKAFGAGTMLRRWIDMPAKGWYSADSHIHANYVEPSHQVMTPEDMKLIAEAEDLHIPNLLVANSSGAFVHDRAHFEGKPHRLSTQRNILYYNEEFRSAGLYGHMAFFRLKSLIEPFFTGFRNAPDTDDYPPNYTAAKEGKNQNAAVVYVHPGMSSGLDQRDWGASAKELPVDAALRVIDAMDVLSNNEEQAGMEIYHRLLNCGLRLGISSGTDSFVNVTDHYTPGGGRVYVHTPGPLRYDDWVDRYRTGHSFATNGPMIDLKVNGKEPGDEVKLDREGRVQVSATISTRVPLDMVDVLLDGVPVISKRGIDRGEMTLSGEVEIARSGWIAVRVRGPRHRSILNDTGAFAHTSPVYLSVKGKRAQHPEDARFFLAWIDRLRGMVESRGRFSTAARKKEVLALLDRAAVVYKKLE